ncbi:MAG: nucleotide sugar dehydrogenase [Piscinibacter sp.]|nr:nucleotide sugar dehydrogenase [Piscinibacter sp.]
MPLSLVNERVALWRVGKIAVVGPGIVGMPMAALLAHAKICEGSDSPAHVTVIQRNSATSGWKVDAINAGRSPIGGVEPDLERIVAEAVAAGLLSASHGYAAARDADVILICTQTDKLGLAPDYGPLFEALEGIARELAQRPPGNVPLIVFESTLAPSTMATLVRDFFAERGLVEGRDVLLGNSPNRVMPGRLVERVASSDKLVAGLHPDTPGLIERLYRRIVTRGTLHPTNSMTAEVVKTLENAYRDVRVAYASEVSRHCDAHDIDFYALRDQVNAALQQQDGASADPNAVPSGGLLVPTVGVGGHCLPKDGILLWWRALEAGLPTAQSLILESRRINDDSPAQTLALAERRFGSLEGRSVALLGTAYRFNSEDTRNSPTLTLARLLLDRGARIAIHDPYVYPTDQNLKKTGLTPYFTRDLVPAVEQAEVIFLCTGHRDYVERRDELLDAARQAVGVVDACNLWRAGDLSGRPLGYTGIGRGTAAPPVELVAAVIDGFRTVEAGVANEVDRVVRFLNERYAADEFNRVRFSEVQRIAGTCITGCAIVDPRPLAAGQGGGEFRSRLVAVASGSA